MFSRIYNSLTTCRPHIQRLSITACQTRRHINPCVFTINACQNLHTSPIGLVEQKKPVYTDYNDIVYPPQEEGMPARPAEVCHVKPQLKYSPKKFWYITLMIRGKSVDEALKQLQFYERQKGARIAMALIEEAQELAVKEHNVEYKSNLWIESCHVSKGKTIKGLRKHGRNRGIHIIHYRYSHLFIRLREGKPPKQYYVEEMTGNEHLKEHIDNLRERPLRRTL